MYHSVPSIDRNIRIVRQIGAGFKPYCFMFKEFKKQTKEKKKKKKKKKTKKKKMTKKKKKKKKKDVTATKFLQKKTLKIFKIFFWRGGGVKFNYSRLSLFAVSSNLNSAKRR